MPAWTHIKARVEDPFQLVGMNALGLPGATIDGILGFTILARFQLEIDPTQDRMTWTRLDYEPRDLPVPEHKPGEQKGGPPEVQAMNALGPIAKGLALLIGRQPEEQRHPRGFLGVEWSQELSGGHPQLYVRRVLSGSAAAKAGLEPGDLLLRIKGQPIDGVKAARTTLGELEPGEKISLLIRRSSAAGSRELTLQSLPPERGFNTSNLYYVKYINHDEIDFIHIRSIRKSSWCTRARFGFEPGTSGRMRLRHLRQRPERAPTQAPSTAKPAKVIVPFEMLPTNHMLVRARINDKGPYLLVFDLGAPITLLGNTRERGRGGREGKCTSLVLVRDARRSHRRQTPGRQLDGRQAARPRVRPPCAQGPRVK